MRPSTVICRLLAHERAYAVSLREHRYSSTMRILVLGSYDRSLLEFRGELIKAFIRSGHEVIAAAPDMSRETESGLKEMGATPVETPLDRTGVGPLADLKYLRIVMRLLRTHRPDKILAYTMKPVIWGSLASRLTGIGESNAMITGLGYALTSGTWKQRLVSVIVRRLLRTALARSAVVFFQNPDDRDRFLELKLIDSRSRVVLINGSGVDTERFEASPVPDDPVFLMIARLLEDKGVREYAAAAASVRARYPTARFDLAGWLDSNPRCIAQDELDGWTESGVINFLGKLADVRPAIRACSVYVLPSYREGTPRTNLEAMSMGRPVITTDAPGCRETVEPEINGILVNVGDADSLADAMIAFLDGTHSAAEMGVNSRQIAERKYDVHTVNRAVLDALGL